MSTYVNLEILHTLPFSNANRDDAGQPKTVSVGGVMRGRLSSQSLKRAARFYDADKIDGFGFGGDSSGGSFFRTRYVKNLITERVKELGGDEEAIARVSGLFGDKKVLGKVEAGKGSDDAEKGTVLIVLTQGEIDSLARMVLEGDVSEDKVRSILRNSAKRDIALWGRFFASSHEATIDGSAQVSHAFTTHGVNVEPDFFVGLDDAADLFADHAGAGHPGDSFYLTGTFYKYANFNVEETVLNLLNARAENKKLVVSEMEEEEAKSLVDYVTENFIKSFVLSVPQGKIRATAHQTLPSLVRVSVRKDRPVNGATAFEQAIRPTEKNIPLESVKRLAAEHEQLEAFVGAPEASFVLSKKDVAEEAALLGNEVHNLNSLVESTKEAIRPAVEAALARLNAQEA